MHSLANWSFLGTSEDASMATRKSSKPAGRAVKDEEVKSAYHDEVLNWLIENLDEVVSDRWGMDSDRLSAVVEKARSSALEWLDGPAKRKFDAYASGKVTKVGWNDEPLGKGVQEAMIKASSRIAAVRDRIVSIRSAEDSGDAKLKTYEVMKRVSRIETKSVGAGYNKRVMETSVDAGYVDLCASAYLPTGCAIRIAGASYNDAEHFVEKTLLEPWDSDSVRKFADAFSHDNVRLTMEVADLSVWFSVRTGDFTLGEILQELKDLAALEKGDHAVALVVDGIDPRMLSNIEHEGFVVVDRDDYERC